MSTFCPTALFWRKLGCTVDLTQVIFFIGAALLWMNSELSAESMPMTKDSSKHSLLYFLAKAGRGDCQTACF